MPKRQCYKIDIKELLNVQPQMPSVFSDHSYKLIYNNTNQTQQKMGTGCFKSSQAVQKAKKTIREIQQIQSTKPWKDKVKRIKATKPSTSISLHGSPYDLISTLVIGLSKPFDWSELQDQLKEDSNIKMKIQSELFSMCFVRFEYIQKYKLEMIVTLMVLKSKRKRRKFAYTFISHAPSATLQSNFANYTNDDKMLRQVNEAENILQQEQFINLNDEDRHLLQIILLVSADDSSHSVDIVLMMLTEAGPTQNQSSLEIEEYEPQGQGDT